VPIRQLIVPAFALAVLAGACSSSDDSATTTTSEDNEPGTSLPASEVAAAPGCEATDGAVVGYSEPLPDPNFAIVEAVLEQELAKVGATVMPVNANLDPGKQISDINTLQQQGIDVLLVNPVDPNAVQDVLGGIMDSGTPVIVQDTQVGGPYTSSVQSDSGQAASDGAKLLAANADGGTVVAMKGPPFAEILERSRTSFEEEAAAQGLEIANFQTNMAITPDAARQVAEQWKQQYGEDLAGIWTFNDVSAIGVASTFDGDFAPMLVSVNGQPDAIPLVEAGKIAATYDLQVDMAGRALAYAAIESICGNELPKEIWIGSKVVDKSNVADWVPPEERAQEPMAVELEQRDGKSYVKGS